VKRKPRTRIWDPVEYLRTEAEMTEYLAAALEDGDASLVAAVLGDIARAKGMARVSQATGLGRESLYKALSPDGNPQFDTVLRVLAALGLRLKAVPATR
jgi:probable addiction module antidote protein